MGLLLEWLARMALKCASYQMMMKSPLVTKSPLAKVPPSLTVVLVKIIMVLIIIIIIITKILLLPL